MPRSGWTLLELMVVITLIALMVSMATVNFRGPLLQTRFNAFQQQIVDTDHLLRRQCLQSNQSGHLTIDCDNNQIRYTNARNKETTLVAPYPSKLTRWMDRSGKVSKNVARIHYDSHGASGSFAVCIRMGEAEVWVVLLGRTGEYFNRSSESEARELLNDTKQNRVDAR